MERELAKSWVAPMLGKLSFSQFFFLKLFFLDRIVDFMQVFVS
jgi:hypothetical protein